MDGGSSCARDRLQKSDPEFEEVDSSPGFFRLPAVRHRTSAWHWAENGEQGDKFDSSKDRGEPFIFPLGGGKILPSRR